MLRYEGGGHPNAGTCQIANDRAAEIQQVLIDRIVEFNK
jgi:nanoRNase/pAp phosphatase (c-di-AMP/oligoRNAs hydrolase)